MTIVGELRFHCNQPAKRALILIVLIDETRLHRSILSHNCNITLTKVHFDVAFDFVCHLSVRTRQKKRVTAATIWSWPRIQFVPRCVDDGSAIRQWLLRFVKFINRYRWRNRALLPRTHYSLYWCRRLPVCLAALSCDLRVVSTRAQPAFRCTVFSRVRSRHVVALVNRHAYNGLIVCACLT